MSNIRLVTADKVKVNDYMNFEKSPGREVDARIQSIVREGDVIWIKHTGSFETWDYRPSDMILLVR